MFSRKSAGAKSGYQEGDTYERKRWKHYMRWACFGLVLFTDFAFVETAVNAHLVRQIAVLPQEFLGFALLIGCNLFLLPSIVLEADRITVTSERIIVANLFMRFQEKWEDLVSFSKPVFLKFALLKGKKFIYLINRRDIERYDELVETIEHKAGHLRK